MPKDAPHSSTHGCPSQKLPPSLDSALKTEKKDAPIVGIGQQLETTSPVLTRGATTSSIDVNDDKDRQLIATTGTSMQTTSRKRPAVNPKDDNGTPDPTGIINLLDDDNKEEDEEEEEEIVFSIINIDDDTEFPSLSSSSSTPPLSPSPAERPKKELILKEHHRNSTVD
jgi:hypothetical protein